MTAGKRAHVLMLEQPFHALFLRDVVAIADGAKHVDRQVIVDNGR